LSSLLGSSVTCSIADSPSGAGKCVLSDTIESVTADKWLDAFEKDMHSPPELGFIGSMMASVKFDEQPPDADGWFVTVTEITHPLGTFKTAMKNKFDKAAGAISRCIYAGPDPVESALREARHFQVHRDPFRVECWVEKFAFHDVYENHQKQLAVSFGAVFESLGAAKDAVTFTADADSPSMPGKKSIVSSSMKGIATLDEFWEHLEKVTRADGFPKVGIMANATSTFTDGFPIKEVMTIGESLLYFKHEFSKEKGTWDRLRYADEAMTELLDTMVIKGNADTLVLEAWTDQVPGARFAGRQEVTEFQGRINDVVKKVPSEGFFG